MVTALKGRDRLSAKSGLDGNIARAILRRYLEGCLGFCRAERDAGTGTQDKDRREEKRIRRYRTDRTGSALASMEFGIRAELRSAEMSVLVPLAVYPTRCPPTDRPKRVQAHADRDVLQASPGDIRYL